MHARRPAVVAPEAHVQMVDVDVDAAVPRLSQRVEFVRVRRFLERLQRVALDRHLGVSVQAEFEQILKPGYQISGSRFETRRFQAMGQLDRTCTAPPARRPRPPLK
jgi:hypothetical protein